MSPVSAISITTQNMNKVIQVVFEKTGSTHTRIHTYRWAMGIDDVDAIETAKSDPNVSENPPDLR